jgi:sarcosine oxidase
MPNALHTDVAVVGLGAMGAATLYQLAKRGVSCVGIDRFAPPHDLGSSHGETRITRLAVGEGGALAPFVRRSHEIWRELEAATGETLLTQCGALVMAPGGAPSSHHGKPDFVARSIAVAEEFGIAHEAFGGAEVRRRFPHFVAADDVQAYFEPEGGYVAPERCIAAQLGEAFRLGARVVTGAAARAIRQTGAGVEIETADGVVACDRAIVAAGAWAGPLLGAPFDRLLTVKRQVLHWFALEEGVEAPEGSPVFIWMHGAGDADYLYGFPPQPGARSMKVATEQFEASTEANTVERAVSPTESAAMYEAHLRGRLAGVTSRAVKAAACMYVMTPDFNFIIDDHPAMDRVTVVSACSGHGFKHSAGIGFALAERAATGRSKMDLAPFALSRFDGRG